MNNSLSIILPVHNAAQTITPQVNWLLEQASELTKQFEIVIVDDGSSDQTEEVVCDLMARYPQVKGRRQGVQQGTTAAVSIGMTDAMGEIVILQDLANPLNSQDLRSLWQMHQERLGESKQAAASDLTFPVVPEPLDPALIERLTQWGADLRQVKESPEKKSMPQSPARRPNFLSNLTSFALGE
ncbi:MAG: glycosyltransferase family 2 protein [Pirellulales bacterium]